MLTLITSTWLAPSTTNYDRAYMDLKVRKSSVKKKSEKIHSFAPVPASATVRCGAVPAAPD